MCVCVEHRNLETRINTDFLVQVRNFLLPLSLKVLRHKDRDTFFLFWPFHLPPPNTCGTHHKATGLASANKRKPTHLLPRQADSTPLHSDFFKIPQILRACTSDA